MLCGLQTARPERLTNAIGLQATIILYILPVLGDAAQFIIVDRLQVCFSRSCPCFTVRGDRVKRS